MPARGSSHGLNQGVAKTPVLARSEDRDVWIIWLLAFGDSPMALVFVPLRIQKIFATIRSRQISRLHGI